MAKTVVVTGGNSGIGLATAHELAGRGATVCLACRNQEKAAAARAEILERTPGAEVDILPLDLASMDSVRAFAELLAERHPKVDALVNNAGAAPFGQQFTEQGYEMQFGANYLAPFLLSHLVLPRLRAAAADTADARFVHVSSLGHVFGRIDPASFRGRNFYFSVLAYAQSKLGNAMFSYALARRLPDGITSNAVHPGIVDSHIFREFPKPVYAVMKLGLASPQRSAKLNADLAIGDEYRGRTGEFLTAQRPMPVSPIARSKRKQDELYARSCELVGIEPL